MADDIALPAIESCGCRTAEDLLDCLSPRNSTWGGGSEEWMFRGQSDTWPLKAKAYRGDEPFKQLGIPPFADPSSAEPRWSVAGTGDVPLSLQQNAGTGDVPLSLQQNAGTGDATTLGPSADPNHWFT